MINLIIFIFVGVLIVYYASCLIQILGIARVYDDYVSPVLALIPFYYWL